MSVINIKRIYEAANETDGIRILVDKLWPRGFSKERAKLAFWAKDLAPSNELRKWYQHDKQNWEMFRKRYFNELDNNPVAIDQLISYLEKGDVTFLFGSKELKFNNAVALRDYIEEKVRT
jgi:uncharacterized protein YeaO (DUF488 family)